MTVSVCPTFACNCHCGYCYLGNSTYDCTTLSLQKLDFRLKTLSIHSNIDKIEIFGGDITLLDDSYLIQLRNLCMKYCDNMSVVANTNRDLFHIFDNVSFSLNIERSDYSQTLQYIKNTQHCFSLNIVVLPSVVNMHKEGKLVGYLDSIPKLCKSLLLIKYSDSAAANLHYIVSDEDYEDVVFSASRHLQQNSSIICQNITELKDYDPLMSSNIFILPDTDFAWICYDNNNREYFKKSSDINEYYAACKNEYNIYIQKCGTCKHFKHCYAEHLNFNKQCSGHKKLKELLDENNIFEAD